MRRGKAREYDHQLAMVPLAGIAIVLGESNTSVKVRDLSALLNAKRNSLWFPHPLVILTDWGIAVKAARGSIPTGAAVVGLTAVTGAFMPHPIDAQVSPPEMKARVHSGRSGHGLYSVL
jgi:hypothetical protein